MFPVVLANSLFLWAHSLTRNVFYIFLVRIKGVRHPGNVSVKLGLLSDVYISYRVRVPEHDDWRHPGSDE